MAKGMTSKELDKAIDELNTKNQSIDVSKAAIAWKKATESMFDFVPKTSNHMKEYKAELLTALEEYTKEVFEKEN